MWENSSFAEAYHLKHLFCTYFLMEKWALCQTFSVLLKHLFYYSWLEEVERTALYIPLKPQCPYLVIILMLYIQYTLYMKSICVCVCVYLCMYTHTYICTHTYTHTLIYTHTHILFIYKISVYTALKQQPGKNNEQLFNVIKIHFI